MDISLRDVMAFIQSVGFPIFVAVWLLVRSDKFIQANTAAINTLAQHEANEVELLRLICEAIGVAHPK